VGVASSEIDPETPEGKNKYISIFNAALVSDNLDSK